MPSENENDGPSFESVDLNATDFIPAVRGKRMQRDEIAESLAEVLVFEGDALNLGMFSKGFVVPVPPIGDVLPGDDRAKIERTRIAARVNRIRKMVEAKRLDLNVNFRELVNASTGEKKRVVYVRKIRPQGK